MSATIKDIARAVGVNPSTVSRVINGTASISEETKTKIYEAMRELDYHPNSMARSLVSGNTYMIGLIIDAGNKDAFSNTFFIQSIAAIETIAQAAGYSVLITNSSLDDGSSAIKDIIQQKKTDGIILPVQCMSDELVGLLQHGGVPFVVMGEPRTAGRGIRWVDVDNELGSRQAVAHLLERGYSQPMLLVEDKKTIFEAKRMQGFMDECKRRGLKTAEVECFDKKKLEKTAADIARGRAGTDSVICANNFIAYETLRIFRDKGVDVPHRVGVVTFDNYPLAEYLDPALSAVDIDTYKLGETAASMLISEIRESKKRAKKSCLIETAIIARASTQRD